MALSAATVWEVRTTATASNVNGGGFKTGASGTDYSQQNAAQYNLTGIASAGAGDTILSAAAAANMVGNIANVVSGTNFTAGRFEILSVVVGVSITFSTNAAGTSICTGVGASGVINIGGALSLGSGDDGVFESMAAGNIVYIKAGTYSVTAISLVAAGSTTVPIFIEGYNSARGDAPTGSTRPLLDLGANTFNSGGNWEFRYLQITGTGTSVFGPGVSNKVLFCKISNTSTTTTRTAVSISSTSTNSMFYACEMISLRGTAYAGASTNNLVTIVGCYIHSSSIGVSDNTTAGTFTLLNNIIAGCYTNAILMNGAKTGVTNVIGNTIYGSINKDRGNGLSIATASTNGARSHNNIFYGLTTAITSVDDLTRVAFVEFNTFFNNTTNVTNVTLASSNFTTDPGLAGATQVTVATGTSSNSGNTLTKSGATFQTSGVTAGRDYVYISAGGTAGMYSIVSVDSETQLTLGQAPGNASGTVTASIIVGNNFAPGSAMKNLGFPAVFPGGLTTGYTDLGAAQRQAFLPTASDLRSGTVVDTVTGTLTVPSLANVKTGVAGDGGTGTYDGSDRWTDAGEANVRSGTAYKANSTSNNKTGTLAVPSAGNVRSGTAVDAGTGTLTVPSLANTKTGVAGDGGTGTYDGSDRWTDPGIANVRSATAYKANSTSNNRTGTAAIPVASDVKTGVSVDATTGSYDGSDRWTDPGEANVLGGVTYKANSVTENKTGALSSGDSTDPGEDNVREGVEYEFEGDDKVGTYDGSDFFTELAAADVRFDLDYIAAGIERTGELVSLATDLRGVLNQILRFIGCESLTDDEFESLDLTLASPATDVYEALYAILDARGVSEATLDKLGYYFQAKGVEIAAEPEREAGTPHILVGATLDATPVADGKSNIFVGGEL